MKSDAQRAYEAYCKANPTGPFQPGDADTGWPENPATNRLAAWQRAAEAVQKSPGQVFYEALHDDPEGSWRTMSADVRGHYEIAALAVRGPVTVREWQTAIHTYAKDKGWWDGEPDISAKLMLMATEVHEAFEEWRNNKGLNETYYDEAKPTKPEGVPVELADVVIRVLDFCEYVGIDMQAIMREKHAYNLTRAYRHGGKRV